MSSSDRPSYAKELGERAARDAYKGVTTTLVTAVAAGSGLLPAFYIGAGAVILGDKIFNKK